MGSPARVAAALSEHPLASHAVGECVGHLLEVGGQRPDAVVVFVTSPLLGALEDIVAATTQLLAPQVLIGSSAVSVLGGFNEVEDRAAVAMFAVWASDQVAGTDPANGAEAIRLTTTQGPLGVESHGLDQLRGASGTLVLLADPFSCQLDDLLADLSTVAPDVQVVGGFASSARQPGGNRLALDGVLYADGAVAVLLPTSVDVQPLVSQGCRPIGEPMTVTSSERNIIRELAGRPALERLNEIIEALGPEDRLLASAGLHLGRVVDEQRDEFGQGDFLIRSVLGGDRETGAIAVDDEMGVGSTVQFQVRDAASASRDLEELLADGVGGSGRAVVGALVFTCSGRGLQLFSRPDHDASAVSDALGGAPVVGMFCAGEIGPIGGRTFVHSVTASVLLFR